ncbi:MAG: hypothetical protein IAE94_08840 [Chthoniobacterales bacterium]|nr:hypothetical protein [Chthoniobacterales bacterium]
MIVHSVLSHHPAHVVDAMMRFLGTLGPQTVFCLGYGGPREEFDRIAFPEKFFLGDPSLRGRIEEQNFSCWIQATGAWYRRRGIEPDLVHFTENDHIPLRADYWEELRRTIEASGRDFLGKWCMDRTNTNEQSYLHYRDDARLLGHLAALSVRSDPRTIWGALADGMLMRRTAVEALTNRDLSLPCFTEILIPSTLHHLGFTLGDFDAWSGIFRGVRHRPAFALDGLREMIPTKPWCCHPFKDVGSLPELYELILRK